MKSFISDNQEKIFIYCGIALFSFLTIFSVYSYLKAAGFHI